MKTLMLPAGNRRRRQRLQLRAWRIIGDDRRAGITDHKLPSEPPAGRGTLGGRHAGT